MSFSKQRENRCHSTKLTIIRKLGDTFKRLSTFRSLSNRASASLLMVRTDGGLLKAEQFRPFGKVIFDELTGPNRQDG